MEFNTIKEVEAAIRRAFEVDRILPAVRPGNSGSLLGKMIIIPDMERSLEDLIEDSEKDRHNLTREDLELWRVVMSEWLPSLRGAEREVVKCRCSGMGWKRTARRLVQKKLADRELDRTTLWRKFKSGLEDILLKLILY